jgi:hypothetical protein
MAAAVLFAAPLMASFENPRWIFLEDPNWGARSVDPPEAIFFRQLPALGAVIREAAQNSLDARDPTLDSSTPVRMRFSIHKGEHALSSDKARLYLNGLNEHLVASGLRSIPDLQGGMPYLVVEDFGTLGLVGEAGPDAMRDDEDNRFYWFHRNVNRTQSNTNRGGSYGYGKASFSLASAVRSFLTVSHGVDGTMRVFGSSIAKTHEIDGKAFVSYGDFGIHHQIDGRGDGALPCEDLDFFRSICSDFGLEREQSPGLSVIVPLPERSYSVTEIAESAIRNYLMPICQGKIIFEISDGNSAPIEISQSSIKHISSRLEWSGDIAGAMSQTSRNSMEAMIDLALWWNEQGADATHSIATLSEREPHWYSSLIPDEILDTLKEKLAVGEPLALRVELPMRRNGQRTPDQGSFTVLLMKREDQGPSDALWFRKYISVPNRKELFSGNGYAAITIADEGCILEDMLRLSEEVAHTSHEYQGVTESFKYARGSIRFYRTAGKHLLEYLTTEVAQIEEGWLSDWFPSEESQQDKTNPRRRRRRSKRKKSDSDDDGVIGPLQPVEDLSRNHSWDVHKCAGGFSIEGSITRDEDWTFRVKAAYARADGKDPIKKWKKFDFDFSDGAQFSREDSGGIIYSRFEGNELVFTIEGPVEDYFVEVSGFEVDRSDVYVKATPRLSRRDG